MCPFSKSAIMSSIDSGSLDSINLPPGFKIYIFADEPGGSPVVSKSHSLDFSWHAVFRNGGRGDCKRDVDEFGYGDYLFRGGNIEVQV